MAMRDLKHTIAFNDSSIAMLLFPSRIAILYPPITIMIHIVEFE